MAQVRRGCPLRGGRGVQERRERRHVRSDHPVGHLPGPDGPPAPPASLAASTSAMRANRYLTQDGLDPFSTQGREILLDKIQPDSVRHAELQIDTGRRNTDTEDRTAP